jgi:hypothetical protein
MTAIVWRLCDNRVIFNMEQGMIRAAKQNLELPISSTRLPQSTPETIELAKKYIEQVGGIENARRALEFLTKLQQSLS